LALNRHVLRFTLLQSLQSRGAWDPRRRGLLDCLFATQAPRDSVEPLFSRVITAAGPPRPASALEPVNQVLDLGLADTDLDLLPSYDADVRNQIRQADRRGLRLRCYVIASANDGFINEAYQ